jgi:DNA repair photolyase
MFEDKKQRLISYHDTWISLDPISGCPYHCSYCVLRHGGNCGKAPQRLTTAKTAVGKLYEYPLFVKNVSPLTIGSETDIFNKKNIQYLYQILNELNKRKCSNPISLVTKSPLSEQVLEKLKEYSSLTIIFFLSFSGLGKRFEPGLNESNIKKNFVLVKKCDFKSVHYWRPLIPPLIHDAGLMREIIDFVKDYSEASVIIGLKLHPELNRILQSEGKVQIPKKLMNRTGEWLEEATIKKLYASAEKTCPGYPLYRHASCALAKTLHRPNHTATVYKENICHGCNCPPNQRTICEKAKIRPSGNRIDAVMKPLGRTVRFSCIAEEIVIHDDITQEEFSYLLHNLNFPIIAPHLKMQNLYHGNIFEGQTSV